MASNRSLETFSSDQTTGAATTEAATTEAAKLNGLIFRKLSEVFASDPEADLLEIIPMEYSERLADRKRELQIIVVC